jgi:hypothetical protein
MVLLNSKVISVTVDALKAQPLLLLIVMVNVLSLLTGAYVLHQVSNATERKDHAGAGQQMRATIGSPMLRRLPIIRHLRWLYWSWKVEQHYAMWESLGSLPVRRHLDEAVLDAIWRGER